MSSGEAKYWEWFGWYTFPAAAKRAGITERQLRHLINQGIVQAEKREGLGNVLWLEVDEIAIARIAGSLVGLGMNTIEMAEWLRKTFDDSDLATDALNGEDIALKITPGDEPGSFVAKLEKPLMNGSVPMVSMIHPQTIVFNLAHVLNHVQKDDRQLVRASFTPDFVVQKDQRAVIKRMLETHNPSQVEEFFAEAAEAAANGNTWKDNDWRP
jgi:DNA-binding transcriptional MerR regulator